MIKYQSQYFCQSSLPFAISHLSRGLKSAGPGADPCVIANKASLRRGWAFDSTLDRQTCAPVFSPASGGNSKGRRRGGEQGSGAMKQKVLLRFYFFVLFILLYFYFPFWEKWIEIKYVLKKMMKELFSAWNIVVEKILQNSVT